MNRTPLRPLASVISARQQGVNPDLIEKENIQRRNEDMQDRARQSAETRLLVLSVMFLAAFLVVGGRMGMLASGKPQEPRAESSGVIIAAQRADITDRNGNILATNLVTNSLYAQPPQMIDKEGAARGLASIFPDMNAEDLLKKFSSSRTFIWLRRKISPEQMQLVHDIGEPGL